MRPEQIELIPYLLDFIQPLHRLPFQPPKESGSERFDIKRGLIGCIAGGIIGFATSYPTLVLSEAVLVEIFHVEKSLVQPIVLKAQVTDILLFSYLFAIHAGYHNLSRFNIFRPR